MKCEAARPSLSNAHTAWGGGTRRPHHRVAKVFDEFDGGAVVVVERITLHYNIGMWRVCIYRVK